MSKFERLFDKKYTFSLWWSKSDTLSKVEEIQNSIISSLEGKSLDTIRQLYTNSNDNKGVDTVRWIFRDLITNWIDSARSRSLQKHWVLSQWIQLDECTLRLSVKKTKSWNYNIVMLDNWAGHDAHWTIDKKAYWVLFHWKKWQWIKRTKELTKNYKLLRTNQWATTIITL